MFRNVRSARERVEQLACLRRKIDIAIPGVRAGHARNLHRNAGKGSD